MHITHSSSKECGDLRIMSGQIRGAQAKTRALELLERLGGTGGEVAGRPCCEEHSSCATAKNGGVRRIDGNQSSTVYHVTFYEGQIRWQITRGDKVLHDERKKNDIIITGKKTKTHRKKTKNKMEQLCKYLETRTVFQQRV